MTRADAVKIYMALENLKNIKDDAGVPYKFDKSFIINSVKNMSILKNEYTILFDASKPYEALIKQWDDEKSSIVLDYCLKDKDEKPIIFGNEYTFSDSNKKQEYLAKTDDIYNSKYKEKIEDAFNFIKDLENEEIEIKVEDLQKIKESTIPEKIEFKLIEDLILILE